MSVILKVLLPTSKGHFRVSKNQACALDLRLTQRPGGTMKGSINILRNSPLGKDPSSFNVHGRYHQYFLLSICVSKAYYHHF